MNSTTIHRRHWLDALFIGLLSLYILAGVLTVPFHGDESTIILMSRDIDALTPDRIATLFFHDPPQSDPATQELRLINGNITFFGIGAMWKFAGFQADVNHLWDWGMDYAYNINTGRMPDAKRLFVSRLWSAFCTVLSTAVLFAIARRFLPRAGAWITALIYALLPALLVNGRRANFEGSSQITLMLLLWAALILTERIAANRDKPLHWLLMGLAAGASIAAKHNSLLVTAPVVGMVILFSFGKHRKWLRTVSMAIITGVATVMIFFGLNPAWWSADPHIPNEVVNLRVSLLQNQITSFGGFTSTGERVAAAFAAVISPPQYYEVNVGWPEWIAEPIRQYEAQSFLLIPLRGVPLPPISLLVALIGVIVLPRTAAANLIRLSALITLLSLLLLNPLPWQRYYLPLAPFWAVFYGAGISFLVLWAWRWIEVRRVRAA